MKELLARTDMEEAQRAKLNGLRRKREAELSPAQTGSSMVSDANNKAEWCLTQILRNSQNSKHGHIQNPSEYSRRPTLAVLPHNHLHLK